ncbi:helix-turn-helix domain-containing protein [Cohnella zeiphila]|uniref:Helix-turn-helix transcriptional regulator n=1 Tax=Cohnella zeiphila TaxID=2761120 RepID=A0A7X0SIT6_9BACL|nr:AraC family transcriptional regulator [Cohnella zeiphila]MBB6729480.1 helix-turn-helix transcriptional regulator [Cohnella zeiphila]
MDCIRLPFPPLPQFITIGYGVWEPGMRHFKRVFDVYDLLFVTKGTLYMREERTDYAIGPGEMLLLEPGKTHVGHRPCEEDTGIYWMHFYHPRETSRLPLRQIAWDQVVQIGTDKDHAPLEHGLYLPKFSSYDGKRLLPLMDDMLRIQNSLVLGNALALHARMTDLFAAMQEGLQLSSDASPSLALSRKIEAYLRERAHAPLKTLRLEEDFHFNPEYLSRCLKKHTGMTTTQYIHYLKMEEAKRLLASTDLSIPRVGETVGIPDDNYFIRLFREKTGLTPGEFRKHRRGRI